MKQQTNILSREQLEKKLVEGLDKKNVLCETKNYCSRNGNYLTCYFSFYTECPFYKTYKSQYFKKDGTKN